MFSHPLGSKWGWLCLICWGAFLATTTGFNTILLREFEKVFFSKRTRNTAVILGVIIRLDLPE